MVKKKIQPIDSKEGIKQRDEARDYILSKAELEAKKKLKKIMTDLAAGHITKKEADDLIKAEKTPQIKPEQGIKGSKKNTRKRAIKSREVK